MATAMKATKTTGELKAKELTPEEQANLATIQSALAAQQVPNGTSAAASGTGAVANTAAASPASPSYYNPRSDDQLRSIAEQQYQSYYDQLRLAAQQKSDRETTALEGQRAGIQRSYQQQLDDSAKQYRQAYSQTDRETLRRGMQRSSYAAQRLANVQQEGAEAGQRIREAQTSAEGNLDAQIAQISGQLADTLAGYDAGQAADVMKRYNELTSEEYERGREAAQYAESLRQWQAQFDQGKAQSDQQVALGVINKIVANGGTASDALLQQAGISRDDFNAMLKDQSSGGGGGYYGGGRSSGGGRRSGTKTSTSATTQPTDSDLQKLAAAFGGNNPVNYSTAAKIPGPSTKIGGKATGTASSGTNQKDKLKK